MTVFVLRADINSRRQRIRLCMGFPYKFKTLGETGNLERDML